MTVDLDKLAELARAATPGPWDNHSINGEPIESVWMATGDVVATWAIKEPRFEFHAPQAREDAAFIAAANPAAVLELLERLRAAEGVPAQEGDFLETMRAARAELEAKGVRVNAAEFLRERDPEVMVSSPVDAGEMLVTVSKRRWDEAQAIVRDLAAAFHHHDSDPNQRGAPCRLCLGVQGDHREECPGRRAVEAKP